MSINSTNNWRFCVVGNIVEKHNDQDGNLLYGTKAFVGGTKVYIVDRIWKMNSGETTVIGLNRFKRYTVESMPTELIENIRVQKIYKPTILEIMDSLEVMDGWPWRGRTAVDKKESKAFVEMWKNSKALW